MRSAPLASRTRVSSLRTAAVAEALHEGDHAAVAAGGRDRHLLELGLRAHGRTIPARGAAPGRRPSRRRRAPGRRRIGLEHGVRLVDAAQATAQARTTSSAGSATAPLRAKKCGGWSRQRGTGSSAVGFGSDRRNRERLHALGRRDLGRQLQRRPLHGLQVLGVAAAGSRRGFAAREGRERQDEQRAAAAGSGASMGTGGHGKDGALYRPAGAGAARAQTGGPRRRGSSGRAPRGGSARRGARTCPQPALMKSGASRRRYQAPAAQVGVAVGACGRSSGPSPRWSARRSAARRRRAARGCASATAASRAERYCRTSWQIDEVERPRVREGAQPSPASSRSARTGSRSPRGRCSWPAGSAFAAAARISPSPQPTSRMRRTGYSAWRTKAAISSALSRISAGSPPGCGGRGRSGGKSARRSARG